MQRTLLATVLGLSALAVLPTAQAATLINTGEPNLSLASLSIDSVDWAADAVNFSTAVSIDSIKTYLVDDTPGETYTIALYKNLAGLPDTDSDALYTGQATFSGSNGWQGLTGLNWQLDAGSYWIGIESRATDTMTYGSLPVPVASGSGVIGAAFTPSIAGDYQASSAAQYAFGLQITGTTPAVPEPSSIALLLMGLGLVTWMLRRQADENDE
jgi:hypothetical protein